MTPYCNINGQLVTKASVTIPYYGLWTADVTLPIPSSSVVAGAHVQFTISNLTMLGTVYRADSFAGLQMARIVGGFGGWGKPVPAQSYHQQSGVMASTVLADAALHVGERVSVAQDQNLGQFYERSAGYASGVLRELSGSLWWVDPSGVTQCGTPRADGKIVSQFVLSDFDPGLGKITAHTEDAASWLPGRSVQSSVLTTARTLSLVHHEMATEMVTEALAA